MSDLTTADIKVLARWLEVPITDEEVEEVTARYNAIMEVMRGIDNPSWQEVDPIPWFADTDWASEPSDENRPVSQPRSREETQPGIGALVTAINVKTPLTIEELAPRIAAREISPVELTKAYLDRIDAVDSKVHAFITVMREEALRSAREAEKAILNGEYRGPLHGIPIGIKDCIFTQGVRTTSGQPFDADFVPTYDATIVRRLKEAGAVLLGKLNLTVWGNVSRTYYPYGVPKNPWELEHGAAGSSNGSAIAVAACMLPAALGSDGAGSIRNPSALCGITGIKPTQGRVSRYGTTPYEWSLETDGPMAWTVRDCALILQVIAGHDPADVITTRRAVPDYSARLTGVAKGLRVAVVKELVDHVGIDAEVRSVVQTAAKVLAEQGASVAEVSLPTLNLTGIVVMVLNQLTNLNIHLPRFRKQPHLYDYSFRTMLMTAALVPAAIASKAERLRNLMRREILEALSRYDVLVYPGAVAPAPKLAPPRKVTPKEEVVRRMTGSPNVVAASNLVGVPSLVLPCGFSANNLPLSLQITGGMFQEATVFQAAFAYQSATRWHRRVPPL